MIAADFRDGWIKNNGVMPVDGGILVDTKWVNDRDYLGDMAIDWAWGSPSDLTHWRLHNARCAEPQEHLGEYYKVCNAFEVITGKEMSQEHAKVFVSLLEMCK
jgi:hypothetical protein